MYGSVQISSTASEDIDETIAFIRNLNLHNERLCNLKVAYPPTPSSTSNGKKNPQPHDKEKNKLYTEDDGLEELLKDIESYVNDDRDKNISSSFSPIDKPLFHGHTNQKNTPTSFQKNGNPNTEICQSAHDVETNNPYDPRIQVLELPLTNGIESSSTDITGVPFNNETVNTNNFVQYYQILHLDVLHFCKMSTFHVFNSLFCPPNWTMIQEYECITCGTSWIYHYPILF